MKSASLVIALSFAVPLQAALTLLPPASVSQGAVAEFRVEGVPPVANPFDPEQISISAEFVSPGRATNKVNGFWMQDYTTALVNGSEKLTQAGAAHWMIRFNPAEAGAYQATLRAVTASPSATLEASTNFNVTAAVGSKPQGMVKIAANNRYFEVGGKTLVLNGENVCWPGSRGTFDYRDWFPAMRKAGENYARLWMCPWAFGIEAGPGTLTNYRQDRAWQLDEVFRLAEENGIYLMLCLDYHGMYQTEPDFWGGNNEWKNNPYNTVNGGMCAKPNDFFTNLQAREIYKKRLRYLVARYGAHPNLLAWQFFNEIDNSYNLLNAANVASWHGALGQWLKDNDPFKHLVTTSLTGSSDRAEIWNLRQMDYAMYHSYGLAEPAGKLPGIVEGMLKKYKKPVMVGEYGVDFRGWQPQADPYLRGLRQGVWSGLLSGSVGTSMSWWWENIHAENVYPLYRAVTTFLGKSELGNGDWQTIQFATSGSAPASVGEAIPNGSPFNATLTPSAQWGLRSAGQLALVDPDSAGGAPALFTTFFHGTAHSDLRNPFMISGWFGQGARMVMHVNSVSSGAILQVRVDGVEKFRQSIPDKDGGYEVNNEYNEDLPFVLPEGKHQVEIRNAGGDWFYLDWIRFEKVLPSTYENGWKPSPVAVGMRHAAESLVYVVNPKANYPVNATNNIVPPLTNDVVVLTNWTGGTWQATWYNPANGEKIGSSQATVTNKALSMPLPAFSEDVAGRILPLNTIKEAKPAGTNVEARLQFPAAAGSELQGSEDFTRWERLGEVHFASETIAPEVDHTAGARFFRVRTAE